MAGELTGEAIKSAIAKKIRSSFAVAEGETTTYPTIYKEKTVQGMVQPCFFIWTMDVARENKIKGRCKFIYQMNVRFEPKLDDQVTYETLMAIGTELLEVLSTISVPAYLGNKDDKGNEIEETLPVNGKQMSFQIIDGVLQLYVTYSINLKAKSSIIITPMNGLNVIINVDNQ